MPEPRLHRARAIALGAIAVVAVSVAVSACRSHGGSAGCALTFDDRGDVRVFAVGHHFRLQDARSYDSFAASYRRHMNEIAPCLSATRPNLVVFPEDAGLLAWFIGSRGKTARETATDSTTAFYNVYGQYASQAAYYQQQFPAISSARSLTLALGDVATRAMRRTFGGIARDYGVYVIAGANLPVVAHSSDAALTQSLGDPDLQGSDGVYVAQTQDVFNQAVLWGPDGNIAGEVNKVFLTDQEEQVLDLSRGSLAALSVLDLPFGKVGVAISRDAFYPPFLDRMEDLGARIVVQPEAWSGWTIEEHPGAWEPDAILASTWSATQKYGAFRFAVTPMLTGNLFELVFDGQTWIARKSVNGDDLAGFVGSRTLPGILSIGPWAYPDPLASNGSLTLPERQAILRAEGEALAPGSGSPDENGYADSVIGADLALVPGTTTPAPGTLQVPIASGSMPAVAADPAGAGFAAAWAGTDGAIRVAQSADGGATWSAAREAAPPSVRAGRPAIAWCAQHVVVAWQEEDAAGPAIWWTRAAPGAAFAAPAPLEASAGAQYQPAFSACESGLVAAAWVDERDGSARVRVASFDDAAGTWSPSEEGDPGSAETGVARAQFSPSVAWAGTAPEVAWIDYRARDWRVWARVVTSGAAAFMVTASSGDEVLAANPQLAPASDGALHVAWEENRDRRGIPDVWSAVLGSGAVLSWHVFPGGMASQTYAAPRYAPTLVNRGDETDVAYQFEDGGALGIVMSAGSAGIPQRIDDVAQLGPALSRPRAAAVVTAGAHAAQLVLWEDLRDGFPRVYARPLP